MSNATNIPHVPKVHPAREKGSQFSAHDFQSACEHVSLTTHCSPTRKQPLETPYVPLSTGSPVGGVFRARFVVLSFGAAPTHTDNTCLGPAPSHYTRPIKVTNFRLYNELSTSAKSVCCMWENLSVPRSRYPELLWAWFANEPIPKRIPSYYFSFERTLYNQNHKYSTWVCTCCKIETVSRHPGGSRKR